VNKPPAIALGALIALAALAELPGPAVAEAPPRSFEWVALPVANFDADAGFGLGGIGSLALQSPGVTPYRAAARLRIFATTRLVQNHELSWDVLHAGHPRLRVFGHIAAFATINRTYCGLGNEVTCDPAEAERAADQAGLAVDTGAREDFVRRYYLRRFLGPGAQMGGRWRLDERDRLSLFASWRMSLYRAGTLRERGDDPGSLYAIDHPHGEDGIASVPQLGIMYDTRDHEPAPTRGVWLEGSVRGAAPATGSTWRFAALNATGRGYLSVRPGLVAATRLAADLAAGDLPVEELGFVGSAELFSAFGGSAFGRGVRAHRYAGRIKLLGQQELRLELPRRFAAVSFVDAGWIGLGWNDVGGDPRHVLASTGAGLRWAHSETFILRADLGLSPLEGWSPQLYLQLGHLF
jgi:hypothetical protein